MVPMSDLYADGNHYDALLGEQTADIAYYMKQVRDFGSPALEIACGTGRITIPLAKAGLDITGLDLSEGMLSHARKKAAAAGASIDWIRADARSFDLSRKFKTVFFPYNSMQHLHDRGSLESMLACVRAHLEPGGHFLLDVHHPNLALLNRRPNEIYTVDSLGDAPDGTVVTGEEVGYDDVSQVYTIRWHYSGDEHRLDELRLRMFFPQELDALLHHNGFEILNKYGDFNFGKFEPGCGKQVLVCRMAP